MKQIKYQKLSILTLLLTLLSLTSCFKELAQNGDFSGQWQVLSIDYPDGTSVDPQGEYYYCIYRDVAQLTNTQAERVTGNLVYDEDAMRFSIQFPYESAAGLAPWGITFPDTIDPATKGLTVNFKINHLTSEQLIMTTEMGVVITCRKW